MTKHKADERNKVRYIWMQDENNVCKEREYNIQWKLKPTTTFEKRLMSENLNIKTLRVKNVFGLVYFY